MKIYPISGDGNCLFHSCGFLMSLCPFKLRKTVSHYLKYHQNFLINDKPISWWLKHGGYEKNYPENIGKNGVFGDGLCLSIISLLTEQSIVIYKNDNGYLEQISEYFPKFSKSIHLLYNGSHYDALIPD